MRFGVIPLFAMLFIAGCSGEEPPIDSPLQVSPLPIQRGDEIHITYDCSHPLAKFRSNDELFVTLIIFTVDRYSVHRILLDRKHDLFTADFALPDDAVKVDLSICRMLDVMYNENKSYLVCLGEDPVLHAIPLSMYPNMTRKEITDLFREDEQRHPDVTDRYLEMWRYRLNTNYDIPSLRRQVDSITNSLRNYRQETRLSLDLNRFTSAVGGIYMYSMYGEYEKALEVSEWLAESARRNKQFTLTAAEFLECTWEKMFHDMEPGMPDRSEYILPAMGNLLDVAIELRIPRLLMVYSSLNFVGPPPEEVKELLFTDKYWLRLKETVISVKKDEMIEFGDFVYTMSKTMLEKGEFQACISLANKYAASMDTMKLWMRTDKYLPVDITPRPGIEAGVSYNRIQAYKKLRKTAEAVELMRNAARRQYHERYAWIMGRSMVDLVHYYSLKKMKDSAGLYLGWIMLMNTYDRKEVYDNANRRFRNTLPSPDELKQKYYRKDLGGAFPCPEFTVETERGKYMLGKNYQGTILLLFSSRTCGFCSKYIPEMIEGIRKNYSKDLKIVVFTDEGKEVFRDYLVNGNDKNIEYAWFNPGIMYHFQQQAVPAYVLVRNNQIVSSGAVGSLSWRCVSILKY